MPASIAMPASPAFSLLSQGSTAWGLRASLPRLVRVAVLASAFAAVFVSAVAAASPAAAPDALDIASSAPSASRALPAPGAPASPAASLRIAAASVAAPKAKTPAPAPTRPAAETYPVPPEAVRQPGVPQGELLKFTFDSSKIFPGTTRDVTVYVPVQYKPERPACVHVNQDGVQWNAPIVFDNLIHQGAMPVTIGVFVRPGVVPSAAPAAALDRFNRSFEYDSLNDNYARFLLDELLPAVERLRTADGRPLRLSRDGNDRSIGGSSSGAICAFTAAWQRPDAFRRVFSAIGTYVGLRGGDTYSTLVRKYEPRPLRVFLQDGSNDNNSYAGDWWMANQMLARALGFSGYDVRHAWGEGAHNGKHAAALAPEAMRWLWRGWPEPVRAGTSKNATLAALLIPGEDWQLVAEGFRSTEGPAVSPSGEFWFVDMSAARTYRLGADGKPVDVTGAEPHVNGQAFGPDGRRWTVSMKTGQVRRHEADGRVTVVAEGLPGNDIVVAHNGNAYFTNPPADVSNEPGKIWLLTPSGERKAVDTFTRYANGIALSPDQSLLYVADYRSHWVYSYVIRPDGTLAHKQRFFWLHTAADDDQSNADGIRTDREGRLYVATRLGIQVCDQAGKVQCILPTPNGRCSNLVFGGPKGDTLFATSGNKVFRRRLNTVGAQAWAPPQRPAPPRL